MATDRRTISFPPELANRLDRKAAERESSVAMDGPRAITHRVHTTLGSTATGRSADRDITTEGDVYDRFEVCTGRRVYDWRCAPSAQCPVPFAYCPLPIAPNPQPPTSHRSNQPTRRSR